MTKKFLDDIKGTIYFFASSVNQLIDLAEKQGLYPQGELDLLKDEEQSLIKELKANGTTKEIWSRLSDIKDILRNGPVEIADDLWNILAAIETFIDKYYSDSE